MTCSICGGKGWVILREPRMAWRPCECAERKKKVRDEFEQAIIDLHEDY